VPKGFEMLLPYLRSDAMLRQNFFSRLKVLFYAGASLARHVWDELQQMAVATTGERVIFLSSIGSTETAPAALARTWESEHPANIGLPLRGVELKLVPSDGKFEGRYRGPNITPGYWRRPDLTQEAFDDEGFYRMGDALKWADAADPGKGLQFDGRLAEDFKLASGTWVSVGMLRAQFIDHCAPLIRDVVITGADRDDIGVLVFADIEACRRLAGLAADSGPAAILGDARLRDEFRKRLAGLAKQSAGSSTRICRMLLLAEPPSLDAGEATDKGSINQRAVLTRRVALVEELYESARSVNVISIGG
jgi:feruloyl-CoA synthase